MSGTHLDEETFHDRFYDQESRLFATPLFQRVFDRSATAFSRAARLNANSVVLSLGCGNGHIERRLAPHVYRIVALDISTVAIEQAKKLTWEAGMSNIDFRVGDLSQAKTERPKEDERLDAVCAFAFLHHLADDAIVRVLEVARGLLKPNGSMYSSDPSSRRLIGSFRWLVRREYDRTHSPDERELNPERVRAMYRYAGFRNVHIEYFDFASGPFAWLLPGTPRWAAQAIDRIDRALVRFPVLRRFSSSFEILATV
jgi:SAM-dependent methyltransferase